MNLVRNAAFVLLVLLAGAGSLYAQRPGVAGKVIDRSTRRPVIDASVTLGPFRVNTDHKGEFEIWDVD